MNVICRIQLLRLRLGLNRRSFDRQTLLGRFFAAQQASYSVEKAKPSSIPVDLRERLFDAGLSTLLMTMAIGRDSAFFGAFGLVRDLLSVKQQVQKRNTRPSLETPWTLRRELDVRPKGVRRSKLRLLRPDLRLRLRLKGGSE